jgi:NAD(P)-dependent dehydrogenase (short-subunit alcohol dehydrogenase family)
MKHYIKDRVVLITGANRGIGKALVDAFLAHGAAKVYAAVRSLESAQLLVDRYKDRVVPLYMDLSKPDSIQAAAGVATDVHIVVNNAGVLSYTTPLAEDAVQQLQQEMEVNVYGFIRVAQAFAPLLKDGGILCQINSVGSLRAHPSVSTYAASKAAAYTLTQAFRTSLKDQGTFVMSVHPGPVATDMIAQRGDLLGVGVASAESVAEEVVQAVQAGDFLCFPDALSKSLSEAYRPFADYVFEQGNIY